MSKLQGNETITRIEQPYALQPRCSLLCIPLELRRIIYGFIFRFPPEQNHWDSTSIHEHPFQRSTTSSSWANAVTVTKRSGPHFSRCGRAVIFAKQRTDFRSLEVLLVCRQIYFEAKTVFYSDNNIRYRVLEHRVETLSSLDRQISHAEYQALAWEYRKMQVQSSSRFHQAVVTDSLGHVPLFTPQSATGQLPPQPPELAAFQQMKFRLRLHGDHCLPELSKFIDSLAPRRRESLRMITLDAGLLSFAIKELEGKVFPSCPNLRVLHIELGDIAWKYISDLTAITWGNDMCALLKNTRVREVKLLIRRSCFGMDRQAKHQMEMVEGMLRDAVRV